MGIRSSFLCERNLGLGSLGLAHSDVKQFTVAAHEAYLTCSMGLAGCQLIVNQYVLQLLPFTGKHHACKKAKKKPDNRGISNVSIHSNLQMPSFAIINRSSVSSIACPYTLYIPLLSAPGVRTKKPFKPAEDE